MQYQSAPSDLVLKTLKSYSAFIILFDWNIPQTIEELEEWIDFSKRLKADPAIFIVGLNCRLERHKQLEGAGKQIEAIKFKKAIFSHIDLSDVTSMEIDKKVKLLMHVLLQDCIAAEVADRRRSTFYPTNDPNLGFLIVK